MAERIGLVLNTFDNETAEVMTDKHSACGGCQDTRKCKSCLSGSDKVVAVVQNAAKAHPGDVVEIHQKTNALLGSAGLFYILPVIGLLVGAFIGGALAVGWNMDESVGAVLAGGAGLGLSLLAVIWFTRTEFGRLHLVPRIIRIVESDSKGDDRSSAKPVSRMSTRSCCGT